MYKETQNLNQTEFGTVIVEATKDNGQKWRYKCKYLDETRDLGNSKMLWCFVDGVKVNVR